MKLNKLTVEEKHVILDKGTEAPFSGEYDDFYKDGIYVCRQCGNHLFTSKAKFNANCGWPSFDDYFSGAVKRLPDVDGVRTEIICAKCLGHLGHVFEGEKFTPKNTRHCVNSLSIKFVPSELSHLSLRGTKRRGNLIKDSHARSSTSLGMTGGKNGKRYPNSDFWWGFYWIDFVLLARTIFFLLSSDRSLFSLISVNCASTTF